MSLKNVFTCQVCTEKEFGTKDYEEWATHLTSSDHQQEAKKKLELRSTWDNEEGTYILTSICKTVQRIPWTMMELAEWLTNYGLLMELYHDRTSGYVVFTVQGMGPGGMNKVKELADIREFKNQEILIRCKADFKSSDWDEFYELAEDRFKRRDEEKMELQNAEQAEKLMEEGKAVVDNLEDDHASIQSTTEIVSKEPSAAGSSTCAPSSSTNLNNNANSTHSEKTNFDSPLLQKATNVPKGTLIITNSKHKYPNSQFKNKVPDAENNKEVTSNFNSKQGAAKLVKPMQQAGPSGFQQGNIQTVRKTSGSDASIDRQNTEKQDKRKKKKKKSKNKIADDEQVHLINGKNVIPAQAQSTPLKQPEDSCDSQVTGACSASTSSAACKLPSVEAKQTSPSTVEPASTVSQTFNFRGGFPSGITSPRPVSESSDHSTQAEVQVPVQVKESSFGDRQPPTMSQALNPPRNKPSGRYQEYGTSKAFHPPAKAEYREPPRSRPQTQSAHPQFPNSQRHPSQKSAQLSFPDNLPPASLNRHGWKKDVQSEGHGRPRGGHQEKQKNEGDLDRARPSRESAIPQQPQITYSQPPSRVLRAPLQQQPFNRDALDNRNIISPQLSSQIPPKIYKLLINPITSLASGSRAQAHPYYSQTLFPNHCELFQKLADDPYSPNLKNSKIYSSFNRLSLANQLEDFFKAQALAEEELRVRWQLILDISFILRQEYPNCELYPFGSILTGLGDFHSDIDIYVDLLGDSASNNSSDKNRKLSSNASLDMTKKMIKKSKCPHTARRFANFVIPVTSAKVPILKLVHSMTRINCDLSFENRLSVQNTKLLRFYMKMDARVLKFTVLIRYWAKFHNLTGSNSIKNYALTLLVLVYLCKKSLVPTVHLLQALKSEEREYLNLPSNSNEIDGWDASFCDSSKRINDRFQPEPYPGENSSSTPSVTSVLIKMAVEFFTMYANLDFSNVVVCPLLGEFLPRTRFSPGSERLPNSLKRYTDWAMGQPLTRRLNTETYLCVQDPFLLSYNVGSVTPQSILFKFQIACAKAAQVLGDAGELESLLDVFIPLPPHVGDKKFMRVYKTESRMEDLRKEIKAAVKKNYYMDNDIDEKSSTTSLAQPMSQKSNYIALPSQLAHLDPIMDEKCMKQMDKKARWETFMVLPLSQQFEAIFVTELTLCKIQNHRKIDMVDALCELWREFTLDFMSNFFVKGLKLELLRKRNAESEPTNEFPMNNGRRASEGGRQPRWKLKQLSKKEEETVGPTSKRPFEIELLCRKILGLPAVRPPIQYEILRFEVTYPFWESRPTILKQMVKELPAEVEVVGIPVLPEKQKRQDKRKNKKTEMDQQEDVNPKPNVSFFSDPVIVQGLVSKEIILNHQNTAKKEDKPFSTFSFDILTKLDMSSIHGRPELIVLFEKDSVAKKNQKNYEHAVRSISYIFDEELPNYLIYRLAKMLDLKYTPPPASVVASTSETPAPRSEGCSTSTAKDASVSTSKAAAPSSESVDKHDANEQEAAEESSMTGEKKKSRTKSEEDLLIPSSSCESRSPSPSSRSSSDVEGKSEEEAEGKGEEEAEGVEKDENVKESETTDT